MERMKHSALHTMSMYAAKNKMRDQVDKVTHQRSMRIKVIAWYLDAYAQLPLSFCLPEMSTVTSQHSV
jgi:hypothetical protein